MKMHLLGFSESSLSRVFDVLWMTGYREKILIVENKESESLYPFAHPSLPYERIFWNEWKPVPNEHKCLYAVTGTKGKQQVYQFFNENLGVDSKFYGQLIHSTSIISDTVEISNGCFIEPGSIITSFAKIGFSVTINRGVTVGHHTIIDDFVTVNPGVHIAGHCVIGKGTQIGIGATIFNGITIGSNCVIGGGSVVTKDIPDNSIAWGNPCKVVKTITDLS